MDQFAALKGCKRTSPLGGDPAEVTIAGKSAVRPHGPEPRCEKNLTISFDLELQQNQGLYI
jgi:hypothetical protein